VNRYRSLLLARSAINCRVVDLAWKNPVEWPSLPHVQTEAFIALHSLT